jgi:hypothetical protein
MSIERKDPEIGLMRAQKETGGFSMYEGGNLSMTALIGDGRCICDRCQEVYKQEAKKRKAENDKLRARI